MVSLTQEMQSYLTPAIKSIDFDPDSSVAKYYANRSILITGATGFIGKAVIEKLIRSCKDIKRIYILVREKRGKTIHERLTDLIQASIFDRIRDIHGGSNKILEEKLYAISGDITLPCFGISAEDTRLLANDCSIIINSAATIRFSEPIEAAVRNNIYSVGQLIDFCDRLDNLEAIVHLSTAFSNCHKQDTVYEIFYEPPMRGAEIEFAVEQLKKVKDTIHVYPKRSKPDNEELPSRDACILQPYLFEDTVEFSPQVANKSRSRKSNVSSNLDESTSDATADVNSMASSAKSSDDGDCPIEYDLLEQFARIAGRQSNRPNTYCLTKAISENYLLDKLRARSDRYLGDGKIPVSIIRPSVVLSAWRDPAPGWVDNYNGSIGGCVCLYTGAIQSQPGDGSKRCDIIPIDMTANMILTTGWFLGSKARNQGSDYQKELTDRTDKLEIKADHGVYIFNMVSGYRNPVNWRKMADVVAAVSRKFPTKFIARLPPCPSYFFDYKVWVYYDFINHKLPAHLLDFVRSKIMGQTLDRRKSAVVAHGKIRQMYDAMVPFLSNEWLMCDTNVKNLSKQLTGIDKDLFNFDITVIDWSDYLRNYTLGFRQYLLNDPPSSLTQAVKCLRRREMIYNFTLTSLLLLIFYFMVHGTQIESMLLHTIGY